MTNTQPLKLPVWAKTFKELTHTEKAELHEHLKKMDTEDLIRYCLYLHNFYDYPKNLDRRYM